MLREAVHRVLRPVAIAVDEPPQPFTRGGIEDVLLAQDACMAASGRLGTPVGAVRGALEVRHQRRLIHLVLHQSCEHGRCEACRLQGDVLFDESRVVPRPSGEPPEASARPVARQQQHAASWGSCVRQPLKIGVRLFPCGHLTTLGGLLLFRCEDEVAPCCFKLRFKLSGEEFRRA